MPGCSKIFLSLHMYGSTFLFLLFFISNQSREKTLHSYIRLVIPIG